MKSLRTFWIAEPKHPNLPYWVSTTAIELSDEVVGVYRCEAVEYFKRKKQRIRKAKAG